MNGLCSQSRCEALHQAACGSSHSGAHPRLGVARCEMTFSLTIATNIEELHCEKQVDSDIFFPIDEQQDALGDAVHTRSWSPSKRSSSPCRSEARMSARLMGYPSVSSRTACSTAWLIHSMVGRGYALSSLTRLRSRLWTSLLWVSQFQARAAGRVRIEYRSCPNTFTLMAEPVRGLQETSLPYEPTIRPGGISQCAGAYGSTFTAVHPLRP